MIIGNTASERQENAVVNEGTNDQDFTVGTSNISTAMNKNATTVKTLERCFNERIDREMNNIVDAVEDRIQSAILAAIDNIVAPKIELAIRSLNAFSGRDVTSVSANSECREHAGIGDSFENASENNNTIGVTSLNDEARRNSQDVVSELSVPGTQSDRQSHIHHVMTGGSEQIHNAHHKMKEPSNETITVAAAISDSGFSKSWFRWFPSDFPRNHIGFRRSLLMFALLSLDQIQ